MTEEQFEKARDIRNKIQTMEENRRQAKHEESPKTYFGYSIGEKTRADWRAINEAFWTEQIEEEKKKLAEL